MTQSQNPRYAVIAGNGRFPFLVLEGAREQGVDPVVIAIQEEAWPELAQKAQSIHWLSLGEIAKVMDVQLFRPIKADQMMSNALATLPCRNTDALIGAFVGMLEEQGIEVLDSTTFLKPLLAGVGLLTRREPELSERADVEYGREIAKKIAGLDIGQTVVVADRACVAVEAMEGTDETIERAARLSNGRRLVVVKVSKPDQDMRFDVPVVGVKTIEVMDRANARVLAVDAGKTLLFERDLLLSKANDCGITIVGMED